MIRSQSDLHVAASPEDVFDRLADMRNDPHWNPMVIEMEKIGDGPVGSGTRFEGKMKRVGPMHMVITEYDRPRRLAMRGGGRPSEVDFSVSFETAEGGTRVRTQLDMEPRSIAKLFSPLMARQVPKQQAESMQAFKRWVEGGSP